MKTSRRVLATSLLAMAASGYVGISGAGPHGGGGGFRATSSGRFGINGITGFSQMTGTRLVTRSAIKGPGVERNAIIGTGVDAIIGTGLERNGVELD